MAITDTLKRLTGPTVFAPHSPRQGEVPAAASAIHAAEAGGVLSAEDVLSDRKAALEECERQIRWHRKSWIYCGQALARIQREQLFLDHTFASFEEYVLSRHDFITPRQAWTYIRAAAVAENVKSVRHQLSLRAAVKLARLPAERQAECLERAIAGSGSKSPPASYLADAVNAMLGKKKSKGRKRAAKIPPVRYLAGKWTITALPKAGADPRELTEILRSWLDQLEQQRDSPSKELV